MMPKAQHRALRRKGFSDEQAYKIMNAQKSRRKKKESAMPKGKGKGKKKKKSKGY